MAALSFLQLLSAMSRLTGGPLSFASRTTFDALEVDTGEESEVEEVEVAPLPETCVVFPN